MILDEQKSFREKFYLFFLFPFLPFLSFASNFRDTGLIISSRCDKHGAHGNSNMFVEDRGKDGSHENNNMFVEDCKKIDLMERATCSWKIVKD